MLKLLLNHWQANREPAPFVLTEDPLYCSHLTTPANRLPEVYSVNRVNPIFEDDEEGESNYAFDHHKRSYSENETRSSDDTGYASGHKKDNIDDDDSFDRRLSSDSDEPSKSVIVSADVHRVSEPDDVIVLSRNNRSSFYSRSISSHSTTSQDPYDSLTATNHTPTSSESLSITEPMKISGKEQTEVKRPSSETTMNAREKLERLLQHGNQANSKDSSDSGRSAQGNRPEDTEKTKNALLQSLTRALHQKVPKTETHSTSADDDSVTRTDSTRREVKNSAKVSDTKNTDTKETVPLKIETKPHSDDVVVTRRDESSSSSSNTNSSISRKKPHRRHNHVKRKESVPKPITLQQLLPGHWSYDNVYLPQMPGVCYHCLHHHHHQRHGGMNQMMPLPDADLFYPMYYQQNRSRHSWAPTSSPPSQKGSDVQTPHSSKKDSGSDHRSSPDGSSHESDSHQGHDNLQPSLPERRSLRVPKKCKCEDCLSLALDGNGNPHPHFPHLCSCCYLPHRKVKFASDTDLSRPLKEEAEKSRKQSDEKKSGNTDKLNNPIFPINLHRLNGHVNIKTLINMEDEIKSKLSQSSMPRGQKEPIKMDEFYRSYPINFREWESHYRRNFVNKRRKRALNMIAMAIGIILVVGVAVAMTFIFLRMKRPS